MDITTEELARACCMCKTVCTTENDLMVHIESHEIRKNNILTNKALGVDNILNDGSAKTICQLCHRIFRKEVTYLFHRKKQYLPLKSICEHCGQAFVTSNLLNKHIRGQHKTSNFEKVPCTVCAKLVLRKQLKIHERLHEKKATIGRFKCQICPKVYTNKYQLKFHVMSHLKFKPFGCTVCSKKFTIQAKLKIHMRVFIIYKNPCVVTFWEF
jgi:KRAB domain-containing zinc finger protein